MLASLFLLKQRSFSGQCSCRLNVRVILNAHSEQLSIFWIKCWNDFFPFWFGTWLFWSFSLCRVEIKGCCRSFPKWRLDLAL
jgi:hypothetical protein